MVTFKNIPSSSSVFSAYASFSASIMLFQTMMNQLVPHPVQNYISSVIRCYFKPRSSKLIFLIEERDGISINEIYSAAEMYLYAKLDSRIECLKITKRPKEACINIKFARCGRIVDLYEGIEVVWRFNSEERKRGTSKVVDDDSGHVSSEHEKRYFELSFNKKHKDMVLNSYVPYIIQKSKDIKAEKKVVKLHTLSSNGYSPSISWECINLEHPSTFDTLALDKKLKQAIIEDLDRFVRRKDFYRKVGKAWKRGYLLHGPPGTGKSSLIAAMANYLKFDIYDLELASIKRDSDLRRLLLRTANRSILVIEDIDCSVELPDRKWTSKHPEGRPRDHHHQFTLSGLLNFIDGLWSSCGDERIIIFTTNNKDKLDPALLRAGRMDMHISMSYLTGEGFRTLAAKYLNIKDQHWRFEEIEELIESTNITPAEVAEELMKSDDADISLGGLVSFLSVKRKKINDHDDDDDDDDETKDKGSDEIELLQKGKMLKLDINKDEVPSS